jgi:hypothetical protein
MSVSLPWSSSIHALLDLRADGVSVEFVKKERGGECVSLAHTRLATSSALTGIQSAVGVITAVKEMLTKYPQFHPQSVIVFLHTPYTTRTEHTIRKKCAEQTVSAAMISLMLKEIPAANERAGTLVHEYISRYTINGYRIFDPRNKKANEITLTSVRTFVPNEVYTLLIAPLQSVFGVPLTAASFTEMLSALLLRDGTTPPDFRIVDIGAATAEVSRIARASLQGSQTSNLGVEALYAHLVDSTEMTRADIATALPLMRAHSAEEAIAKRLAQGLASTAKMYIDTIEPMGTPSGPPVPTILILPTEEAALAACIAEQVPFTTVLPPGDMPKMASVVGL